MTKKEIDRILDALAEQFMQPEIWPGDAWEVQANHGETHIVPAEEIKSSLSVEDFAPYVEGTIDTDDNGNPIATLRRDIWFARLSAPGYLDATDVAIFDTEDEAREYIADTYGDDIDVDDYFEE